MKKELPWFKFNPADWQNGNIQMADPMTKGLFIEICSSYWLRLGDMPYALALQKVCNGDSDALQKMIDLKVLKVVEEEIEIQFLDEQLEEFEDLSKKRQKAANTRWGINSNAKDMHLHTISNARREEKKREEENRGEGEGEKEKILPPVDLILTRMSEVLDVPRSKLAQESGDIKKMLSQSYKVTEIIRAIEGIPIYNLNRAGSNKVMSPRELGWNIDKILAEMDSKVNLLKATSGDLDKYKNIKLNPEETREAREKLKAKLLGKFEK